MSEPSELPRPPFFQHELRYARTPTYSSFQSNNNQQAFFEHSFACLARDILSDALASS